MYGFGALGGGLRPGSARMMRPHNPLMSPSMAMGHKMAEGGEVEAPKMHGGTQHVISKGATIGALLDKVWPTWRGEGATAAPPVVTPAPVPAPTPGLASQVPGYADGGAVLPSNNAASGISPLMQMLLQGYQRSQQNQPQRPYAPAQPNPAGAAAPGAIPGATPAPVAPAAPPVAPKPFTLSGPPAGGGLQSMVPQKPITTPGLMPRAPAAPPGSPIVPFMGAGTGMPGYAKGGAIGNGVVVTGGDQMVHATGPGGGQEDKIDAKLSDGEVVWPADVVSHVGDGSNKEGARRLMAASDQIRAEKAASSAGGKYPEPAQPPLSYIKKASEKTGGLRHAKRKAS